MVLPLFLAATLGSVGVGTGVYLAGSGVKKATSGLGGLAIIAAIAVIAIWLLRVKAK